MPTGAAHVSNAINSVNKSFLSVGDALESLDGAYSTEAVRTAYAQLKEARSLMQEAQALLMKHASR